MVDLGFFPHYSLKQETLILNPLYHVSSSCFAHLLLCICKHSQHPMSIGLGIARLLINLITLSLPLDGVEHIVHLFVCGGCHRSVHQRDKSCYTLLQGKGDHSTVCREVLLLQFHTHCWTVHLFHRTLWADVHECKWASHFRQPKTWSLFFFLTHLDLTIVKSIVVLPSVKWNNGNYCKLMENVRQYWYRCYSHKNVL